MLQLLGNLVSSKIPCHHFLAIVPFVAISFLSPPNHFFTSSPALPQVSPSTAMSEAAVAATKVPKFDAVKCRDRSLDSLLSDHREAPSNVEGEGEGRWGGSSLNVPVTNQRRWIRIHNRCTECCLDSCPILTLQPSASLPPAGIALS